MLDDLTDTLRFHLSHCVGMAANMIGVPKRIIVFSDGKSIRGMLNPVVVGKEGAYQTKEGCLSLPGERETTRWRKITLEWQDRNLAIHKKEWKGFVAEVIQHEMDHLDGVLV